MLTIAPVAVAEPMPPPSAGKKMQLNCQRNTAAWRDVRQTAGKFWAGRTGVEPGAHFTDFCM